MFKTLKTFALGASVAVMAACSSDSTTPVPTADATVVVGEYNGTYTAVTLAGNLTGAAVLKVSSPSKGEVKLEISGIPIGSLAFNATVGAASNNVVPLSVASQKVNTYTISAKNNTNPTGTYNTSTKALTMDVNVAGIGDVKFVGTKK